MSRVSVILEGVDKLSGVINGIAANASKLGSAIGSSFSIASGATSSLFSGFKTAVDSASSAQLDLISSAGAMKSVLGVSFEESMEAAKGLNDEFVKLGNKLPGTTEDFKAVGNAVMDDVFRAYKSVNGIDLDSARDTLMGLTESWTLLGQQSQTNAIDAGQNLTRLLGGDISALKMVQFDRSPAFKSALQQVLEANDRNLKDWGQASTKERAEWLEEATRLTVPPEAITAMSSTLQGVMSEWKNALLDPSTGVFGMLREIPSYEGMTALDGLNKLFRSVDGIFKTLVDKFPFKVDIMEGLLGVFLELSSAIDSARDIFKANDIMTSLNIIGSKIGNLITSNLSNLINSIGPIDISGYLISFINFSNSIREIIISSFTNLLPHISPIFSDISSSVISTLFNISSALVSNFNNLISIISYSLYSTDWSALGFNLGVGLSGAISGVTAIAINALINTDWGGIILAIWNFRNAIVNGVRGLFFGFVSGTASLFLQGGSIIISYVSGQISIIISSALSFVSGIVSSIRGMFANISSMVISVISSLSRAMMAYASQALGIIATLPGRAASAASALVSSIASGISSALSSAGNIIRSAISGAVSGGISSARARISSITSNYRGDPKGLLSANYTVANQGLLQALETENKHKPPGSSIVIANSSEAILTREQQKRIKGGTMINFSPVINVYGDQDVSNKIINELSNLLTKELAIS